MLLAQSCSYKSKNILFKTPNKLTSEQPVKLFAGSNYKKDSLYKHRIKPGDRILVRFLQNYDLGISGGSQGGGSSKESASEAGYLVNYDSSVTLPLLGRLNLVGMTRLEAARYLEELYQKAGITNPIIDVNISTLYVAVYGEVRSPGLLYLDKENTTLVEVLAKCGGLTEAGKKNRVLIIRKDQVILVNLKSISSAFDKQTYIQDGDIIYVEPYGIKAAMEPITVTANSLVAILQVIQLSFIGIQMYILLNQR